MQRLLLAVALVGVMTEREQSGTVAYYRFENNLNDSTGGPAGTMLSGSDIYTTSVPVTTIPQNGLADTRSLVLTPIAIPSFNYAFPFNTPGNATLEFWVNPQQSVGEQDIFWTTTAPGDANRFNVFLGNDIAGEERFKFDYRDINGNLHALFNPELPSGVAVPYAVPLDQWTFIAVVRVGNTYSVYFNHNQSPTATVTDVNPNLPTSTASTLNGRSINNPGNQFVGLIDEVRLSNTALSPSQFLANSVPEPGSLILLGIGIVGLFTYGGLGRKYMIRMARRLAIFALPTLLAVAAPPVHAGTVYDAAADFSIASNPNGVWSYGYETSLGSTLHL